MAERRRLGAELSVLERIGRLGTSSTGVDADYIFSAQQGNADRACIIFADYSPAEGRGAYALYTERDTWKSWRAVEFVGIAG